MRAARSRGRLGIWGSSRSSLGLRLGRRREPGSRTAARRRWRRRRLGRRIGGDGGTGTGDGGCGDTQSERGALRLLSNDCTALAGVDRGECLRRGGVRGHGRLPAGGAIARRNPGCETDLMRPPSTAGAVPRLFRPDAAVLVEARHFRAPAAVGLDAGSLRLSCVNQDTDPTTAAHAVRARRPPRRDVYRRPVGLRLQCDLPRVQRSVRSNSSTDTCRQLVYGLYAAAHAEATCDGTSCDFSCDLGYVPRARAASSPAHGPRRRARVPAVCT